MENATGPTTVREPMSTNTATASVVPPVESPSGAMEPAVATVRARFLGLAPDNTTPSPSDSVD